MTIPSTEKVFISHCPLCKSTHHRLLDERIFRGQQIRNDVCLGCGLVFQTPRLSDEELSVFYEQEYRQNYQGSAEPLPKDLAAQKGRAESLLAFVQCHAPDLDARPAESLPGSTRQRTHLDIGCSAGVLLAKFQDAPHTQPVGIEPGAAYRLYAQKQGLVVYTSLAGLESVAGATANAALKATTLPGLPLPERFDLISMAHVLEHIANPVEYLHHLRETRLTEDGWLLLEVPNLYGHDCFETAHLVSYSQHTLHQVLAQSGFSPWETLVHGMPRSTILPLYITVLARPNSTNGKEPITASSDSSRCQVVPETGVARKRRFAMFQRRITTFLKPGKACSAQTPNRK